MQSPVWATPLMPTDAPTSADETFQLALGEADDADLHFTFNDALAGVRSHLDEPSFTLLTDEDHATGAPLVASTTQTVPLDVAPETEALPLHHADLALEPSAPFTFTGAPDAVPSTAPLTTVPPTLIRDQPEVDTTAIALPVLPEVGVSAEVEVPAPIVSRAPLASSTYNPTDAFQFQPPQPQSVEILTADAASTPGWANLQPVPSTPVPVAPAVAPGSYLAPNPGTVTASTPFVFSPPPSLPGAVPYQAIAPTTSALPTVAAPVVVIVIPPGGDLSSLPPWLTQSIQAAAPGVLPQASPVPYSTSSSDLVGQSPSSPLQPVPAAPIPLQTPDPGPLTPPSVRFQGAVVLLDDDLSARARLTALYPVTPELLFGGSF
ncbi:MAG: hypothetical protein VKK04_26015 [Synechococcales bacterium]|nr:hypothetical protein [Synechococcales bacterium]